MGYLPSILILVLLLVGVNFFSGGLEAKVKERKSAFEKNKQNMNEVAILEILPEQGTAP